MEKFNNRQSIANQDKDLEGAHQRLDETFKSSMPERIVAKIYNSEDKIDYESINCPTGASYYWLVEFSNKMRVPYPLMNLEGPDSNPGYEQPRSESDRQAVIEQEKLIKMHFDHNPQIKEKFELLQSDIFDQLDK